MRNEKNEYNINPTHSNCYIRWLKSSVDLHRKYWKNERLVYAKWLVQDTSPQTIYFILNNMKEKLTFFHISTYLNDNVFGS